MRITTVYRVTTYDGFPRHYFFAHKSEAQRFLREWAKEADSTLPPDIDAVPVELNARGVAHALDNVISMTCVNEG